MQTLTYSALIEQLKQKHGTAIVGLATLSDARARKNPLGKILKQLRAVGLVGADYETSVNREAMRQGAEGGFESEKLPWGEWLIPNKVIVHTPKGVTSPCYYLRTQTTPGARRKCPAKLLAYRDESGKFLSPEEVKPFLPVARESAKQQDDAGLEKTVWVRTWGFDSIQKIRIAGQTYKLVPE